MSKTKQIKIAGVTITYPTLAFVFNPIPIVCKHNEKHITVAIHGTLTIQRTLQAGENRIDVQALARSLFDSITIPYMEEKDTSLFQVTSLGISVGDESKNIDIPILWGALQIGERYTRVRDLYYFIDYPFSVSVYTEQAMQLSLQANKSSIPLGEIQAMSKRNIMLTPYAKQLSANKQWTLRTSDIKYYNVANLSFDFTFHPQRVLLPTDVAIRLYIDTCKREGIYLRWINKYAEYCYYLFDRVSTKIEIEDDEIAFANHLTTVNYECDYQNGMSRAIGKQSQEQIALHASLVDKPCKNLLRSMQESAQVDMWMGYDDAGGILWQGIGVVAGSFANTNAVLQDFDCAILLPAVISQTL